MLSRNGQLTVLSMLVFVAGCSTFPGLTEGLDIEGFEILDLPRSDIPIGSMWIPGIGPTSAGLGEKELSVSQSFDEVKLQSNAKLEGAVRLAVERLLDVEFSAEGQGFENIWLDELEVVRPKDLFALDISGGSVYLFEGVRVKKFSLSSVSDVNSVLQLSTERLRQAKLDLQGSETTGQTLRYTMGDNFYVAYKLVEFAEAKRKTIISKTLHRARKRVHHLGGSYTLTFEERNLDDIEIDKRWPVESLLAVPRKWKGEVRSEQFPAPLVTCGLLTVTFNDQFDPNNTPIRKYLILTFSEEDDGQYKLGRRCTKEGLVTDYLVIEGFAPDLDYIQWTAESRLTITPTSRESTRTLNYRFTLLNLNGHFSIVREVIRIKQFKDRLIKDW